MYSPSILSKFILLFLLFIFTSCQSSQQQSFEQLESALISWYYKYHPTISSKLNITKHNHQIEKYDIDSIEEYKSDINRFMIELSQIDETKLAKEDLIRYLVIDEFLFQMYNNLLNFGNYFFNIKKPIKNLYNSLFFIIHNDNLKMDYKIEFILSRLSLFSTAINNIQKNIIYHSENDLESSVKMIVAFEKLLNNLHLYINADNTTLDEIENHVFSINQSLKKIKKIIYNLNNDNEVDQMTMIENYISYNKNINFNLDYQFLIDEINNKMLNISLPIYKINNDEPVWVDRQDTLNVINSVFNELAAIYPDKNQLLMSLDGSLSRIKSFSANIPIFKTYNANYEIVMNNHTYLESDILYEIWSSKSKTYLFLNKEYYVNNKLKKQFNKYHLDLYNITNYFPGKYLQKIRTREKQNKINSIVIDKSTNKGWGMLSQYILINQGYGESENSIYMLFHLQNVLKAIIKNMIFTNYYIEGKSKLEIESYIKEWTLYEKEDVEFLISQVFNDPIDANFEIIGYLKLKEIYDNFGYRDLSSFNSILIENAHLNPSLIKEFNFSNE